jgi:hypothetical protein
MLLKAARRMGMISRRIEFMNAGWFEVDMG